MTLEEFKERKKHMREVQLEMLIGWTDARLWEDPLSFTVTQSKDVVRHYRDLGLKISEVMGGWRIEIPD